MLMEVEERVDRLEVALEQFITQTTRASSQIERALLRLERMMTETQAQAEKDRQQAEKDRQQAEKDRQQAREERRELARQLGDISNRLGTVVEDIIAPSLRRLAREELGCGNELFFAMRLSKTRLDDEGRPKSRDYDAFYVGEYAIMLNETKATPRPEYARDFVEFLRSGEFLLYFPEYADRPIVPVFSSLYLPAELVTFLTRHGIYAVGMGDEAMQVLNLEQVRSGQGA